VVGCVDTTRLVVGLSSTVLMLAADFVLCFTVTGLRAVVGLGLDLAIFLVAVTSGCLGASVTR
jgi:hypothetical protein